MGFEKQTNEENKALKTAAETGSARKKIPPIEGVFSPEEEVKKILSFSKEERKRALAEFRDKLTRQMEAWAQCSIILEKSIEANPDIPKNELREIVRKFASEYGFPENRIKTAESIIDDYVTARRKVLELREKYPDDIALINKVTRLSFGDKDRNDFKIKTGPMCFEIHCSEPNAEKIYYNSMKPHKGNFPFVGFHQKRRNRASYIVINKDMEKEYPDLYKMVLPHEKEHAKNRSLLEKKLFFEKPIKSSVRKKMGIGIGSFLERVILKKLFDIEKGVYEGRLLEKHRKESDPQEKKLFIEEYAQIIKEKVLNSAKDEMFAMFKEGDIMKESTVWEKYFAPLKPYDYVKNIRTYVSEDIDSQWRGGVEKILVDEYRKTIENAVGAFNRLLENGYETEEVIAIFMDKRLAEWPKTAERMLKEKEKREAKKTNV